MKTSTKTSIPKTVEWGEELQFEVMEDYLRCVEMNALYISRDPKAHMEEMRGHFEKLKSFIRSLLEKEREETRKTLLELKDAPHEPLPHSYWHGYDVALEHALDFLPLIRPTKSY